MSDNPGNNTISNDLRYPKFIPGRRFPSISQVGGVFRTLSGSGTVFLQEIPDLGEQFLVFGRCRRSSRGSGGFLSLSL